MSQTTADPAPRSLAASALPALLVGVGSACILFGADWLAEQLEHLWWHVLPGWFGVPEDARWWAMVVLPLTGLLVGLVLWKAPGHGGHDTATVELVSPPLPLKALPGVAAALILGLAGGVSLGPEGPIIMLAAGLTVVAYRRFVPGESAQSALMIATAAMLGAMLGTPVAAALVLTGVLGGPGPRHLWDRLFAPLVAAGAGAVTYHLLGGTSWDMGLPEYTASWADLLTASLIAVAAALVSIPFAKVFPWVHAAFRRLRHPVAYTLAGGVLLGVLGWIGGEITMFKGAAQSAEILADRDSYSTLALLGIVAVKLVAIVISGAAGFRGGRIFPALFTGVAAGLAAHALAPDVPVALAVGAGVLGVVLVIAHDGWIALFAAVLVSGDAATLPILCVAILPTWLLVTKAPEMIVHLRTHAAAPTAQPSGGDGA